MPLIHTGVGSSTLVFLCAYLAGTSSHAAKGVYGGRIIAFVYACKSCCVVLCRVVSFRSTGRSACQMHRMWPVISCHVLHHAMSCSASCHVMSCNAMSCHVMSCHDDATSCDVMSSHLPVLFGYRSIKLRDTPAKHTLMLVFALLTTLSSITFILLWRTHKQQETARVIREAKKQ